MNRLLASYIVGIISTLIIIKILSLKDKTLAIKVPKDFNTITVDDNLIGYFDIDSTFHLVILDTSLINFRWNDIESKIPSDKSLIQIEYREQNTLYLKPIKVK